VEDGICKKDRPGWDEYFMNVAQLVATRATCNRGVDLKYLSGFKGVGTVIERDRVILATGYNGSPRGLDHCDEVGHELVDGHCIRTVHAEANAIAAAAKFGVSINGASVYTTASPCYDCFKLLINAGVRRIVCGSFYGSRYGASEKVLTLAAQAGIKMEFMKDDTKIEENLQNSSSNHCLSCGDSEEKHSDGVLKIKKLHPNAKVPETAYQGDAGLDLFAVEGVEIKSGERVKVPTGIALEIPDGFVGMIWDRTGVSFEKGLKILGGVVDSSYRGEVFAIMANISKETVAVMRGDKIAQIIIQPYVKAKVEVADQLAESERGDKMLGSSDNILSDVLSESEDEPEIDDYKILDNIENEEEEDESAKSRW